MFMFAHPGASAHAWHDSICKPVLNRLRSAEAQRLSLLCSSTAILIASSSCFLKAPARAPTAAIVLVIKPPVKAAVTSDAAAGSAVVGEGAFFGGRAFFRGWRAGPACAGDLLKAKSTDPILIALVQVQRM